jgi:Ca-activated chloride channel family protein
MMTMVPIENFNTESYSSINESGFRNAISEPQSTFSIDVDRASYSNIRRFIDMGQLPPKDAVRIEEMVNYFDYQYPQPQNNDLIKISTEYTLCPWNTNHQLLLIALQGKKTETKTLPPSNLVFLIDVSGSMSAPNKLPLIQSTLRMLSNELRACDKVAIVVYSGAAGVVLESTPGSNKNKIIEALNQLQAGGSTAGGEGLQLAYKVASENFIKDGNNRIILATDGDFNVGKSSDAAMERMVEQQRDNGIFLTVTGFGMGNIKDNKLEQMADKGNGNYAYIDNSQEARKVFIEEFGATLFTIAKDVKLQLEFNPNKVKAYRLVGYENRSMNNEDFNNDRKDAGELGSGQQVTAMYEIIPTSSDEEVPSTDPLIYQKRETKRNQTNELLALKLRFKNPDNNKSQLLQVRIKDQIQEPAKTSSNLRFTAAVVQYGMLLRDSEHKGNSSYQNTIELAQTAHLDKNGSCSEFIELLKTTVALGDHKSK